MGPFGKLTTAVVVGLLLVGTANSAWSKEQVRVAGYTWPGYGFWAIAKEKNLAPDLEITYEAIEDPYNSFTLLSSGQLEVVSVPANFLPITVARGLPVKFVAYGNVSYGTDKLIVGPQIQEPKDLVGKQVAVLEGEVSQLFMAIWLEQQGISWDQVQMVNIIMDDAVAALASGDAVGGEFWEPYGTNALKSVPGSRVVADSKNDYWLRSGLMADVVFMSKDFVENRRNVAVATVKALYDAIDWYKQNPEEGNKIIAEALKMTVADVELVLGKDGTTRDGGLYVYDFLESARYCGVAPGDPPFDQTNGQIYHQLHVTNEWWVKFGLLEEIVPLARGIDCSLQRELYEVGYAGEPDPRY